MEANLEDDIALAVELLINHVQSCDGYFPMHSRSLTKLLTSAQCKRPATVIEELKRRSLIELKYSQSQCANLIHFDVDQLAHLESASDASVDETGTDDALARILSAFTGGISNDRMKDAARVLSSKKTVNEKLEDIDNLIPIPPTVSANALASMLKCSKTAVIKSDWWQSHRAGEQEATTERRREVHRNRAKQSEHDRPADE